MMRLESFGDAGLWEALSDATRGGRRLGPGKPLALLVYLAAAPGRRSSREHLVDLLWSDRPADEARHVLRQVTWQLRRRLGDRILATVGEELVLTDDVQSDRADFLDPAGCTRRPFRTSTPGSRRGPAGL
jgi:DNA-binding SARP family transcriptional activator